MKKILFFFTLLVLAASYSYAQDHPVSGHVADSSGDAIVGATVSEKGLSSNGTSTNASGNFKLTLKGTSNTIVVTYIGYTRQEIRLGNNTAVQVTLKSEAAAAGGDIVVVGYSRQKKITTTGAISTVSGAELRENPTASLQNTLAGRLPGFFSQQSSGRPGTDGAAFFIRGVSSYNNGSNTPLIIVDDIEYNYDQFARIDPNEIETLSILKDASTTAIYGIRGANGVVIVTTRRGKIGPPKISMRAETSISQPTVLPHYLDAYETAKLYNLALVNDGAAPAWSATDLELFKNGQDPYGHPNVNWREILFKKFSKQYRGNFDISGGTEKVKYFISAGYLYQDGMLKNYSKDQDVNSNYYHSRYNYRSNLDIKVTQTTDLRLDLYGNIGEVNTPNVGSPFGYNDIFYEYTSFRTLAPWAYPVYNPNGTYGYSDWQKNQTNYNINNVVGRLTHYGYNRTFENNINLIGVANQKLDFITKGLSLKGTVAYVSNYGNSRGYTRNQFPSWIYRPATGTYEPRDATIFRIRRFIYQSSAGSTIRNLTAQVHLNYDRTFGSHRVYGLLLYNQNSNTQFSSNSVYNFIPNNFRGLTARVGYNYKQKYLFEFNSGYNGSDRFSEDKRYGFFPAVSAGWNISEEKFFDDVKLIDKLKIRGSYGLVGNDKLGSGFSYYYQQTYGGSGSANFGTTSNNFGGIAEGTLANNEVSWEKENKFDLGLEFSMFKDRLSGTLEYFNNNRYDILSNRLGVSAIFGQSLPPINLGKVNNRGYEIELNWNDKIGKDFSYRLKGTYSVAKNKNVYRDEPQQLYPYQAITGTSIGQQLVYQWIGFYTDSADIAKSPVPTTAPKIGDLKYADLNNDGKIDTYDRAYAGLSTFPNTNAGLQLGFSYKNFSMNAFFQGAFNFNMRGTAEAIRAFSSNVTEIHQQYWTPELGNNALYPRLSLQTTASDAIQFPSTFWFIRADYVRLKTAEIAYTLPKSWVNRLKMQSIKVYTNGYNIFTWTKLNKLYELDPEILPANFGSSLTTDRPNYPPQRTYNFGISATF
jgi:TonB-linked SusC/RagA family outer membrane protein